MTGFLFAHLLAAIRTTVFRIFVGYAESVTETARQDLLFIITGTDDEPSDGALSALARLLLTVAGDSQVSVSDSDESRTSGGSARGDNDSAA